jgi:hypothetical protein
MSRAAARRTVEGMDETYRMLGREHQADLEREAGRRRLADMAQPARRAQKPIDLGARLQTVLLAAARIARARLRPAASP